MSKDWSRRRDMDREIRIAIDIAGNPRAASDDYIGRFKSCDDANAKAIAVSRATPGRDVYVIDSPDGQHEDRGRYVVDMAGWIRAWEATVAIYCDGRKIFPCSRMK